MPTNNSTRSASASNTSPSTELPSGTQEVKSTNSIRSTDFNNLTYSWYPSYLDSPNGRRELQLRNGEFDIRENMRTGVKNLHVELENVSYADLTGDAHEEAIITLGGVSIFNRFVGAVFVYSLVNGKPMPVWQHEVGDRADGGLRRLAVEGRTLIIEEYSRSEGDGGLCCPKEFRRSHYRSKGETLEKIKSQLLPSEYDYAKFLGYPDRSL